MDEKILKIAQEEDFEWFCSLSEAEKIPVVIGLIRMSSGAMIFKMQERLRPLLQKKLLTTTDNNANIGLTEQLPKEKTGGRLDEKLQALVKGEFEEVQYDPKDPLTIEVRV